VLYSQDVVKKLYQATQNEPFFWIDDVLITGTVARKVKLRHMDFNRWELDSSIAEEMMQNSTLFLEPGRFVFGPYELEPEEISNLWSYVKNSSFLTEL